LDVTIWISNIGLSTDLSKIQRILCYRLVWYKSLLNFMYPFLISPDHDENRWNLYNNSNNHSADRLDL